MKKEKEQYKSFAIFYYDDQGRKTLDLPRIADIFRRKSSSQRVFEEESLATLFNRKAQRLAKGLAVCEAGGNADREIKNTLKKIALLARDNEIDRIILPVDEASVPGKHLRDNILYGENFSKFYNVQVDFQNEPYKSTAEIKALGSPKEKLSSSVFDYGLFN